MYLHGHIIHKKRAGRQRKSTTGKGLRQRASQLCTQVRFKEKDGSFDTPVLPSLIVRPIPATLEILDAKHVRFTSDVVGHPWHSEWWSLESHKPVSSPDSEGLLRIQIDFGKIRDQIIKPAGNISESTETP